MNHGKAAAIFYNINSPEYTDEEKGTAIKIIAGMETHNGVTKAAMLGVIRYLWNMIFQMEDDGK
ncbi:MAG: hypothetical protein K6G83_15940 [Lachnospiraceae bacterium]|nr:hypothetical protein [Lachnospiraceae bacterium]